MYYNFQIRVNEELTFETEYFKVNCILTKTILNKKLHPASSLFSHKEAYPYLFLFSHDFLGPRLDI